MRLSIWAHNEHKDIRFPDDENLDTKTQSTDTIDTSSLLSLSEEPEALPLQEKLGCTGHGKALLKVSGLLYTPSCSSSLLCWTRASSPCSMASATGYAKIRAPRQKKRRSVQQVLIVHQYVSPCFAFENVPCAPRILFRSVTITASSIFHFLYKSLFYNIPC